MRAARCNRWVSPGLSPPSRTGYSTFISLARANGGRPDILRWVTHGRTGDITDVYTTLPWPALCDEVSKLEIAVRGGKLIALPFAANGREPQSVGDVMVTRSNVLLSLPLSRGVDGTRRLAPQVQRDARKCNG
jgi:hypothetical protein